MPGGSTPARVTAEPEGNLAPRTLAAPSVPATPVHVAIYSRHGSRSPAHVGNKPEVERAAGESVTPRGTTPAVAAAGEPSPAQTSTPGERVTYQQVNVVNIQQNEMNMQQYMQQQGVNYEAKIEEKMAHMRTEMQHMSKTVTELHNRKERLRGSLNQAPTKYDCGSERCSWSHLHLSSAPRDV